MTDSATAHVLIAVTAPTAENATEWATTVSDLVQAEYGDTMRLAVRIDPPAAAVPSAPADRPASTAPLAAGFPLVQGNCPACQRASLFLGSGGYVTCSSADCPEPDAATTVLEQYADEAHAPEHTWKVESPRCGQWASWGATYDERGWAQERYESAIEHAPTRPFRLVRATATHTVEAEHTPAAVSQPGEEA